MSCVFNLKVKFENSIKTYDIRFNENESIYDQQEKFFTSQQIEGEKKILHLFNLSHGKFITKTEDLKSFTKNNDNTLYEYLTNHRNTQ